MGIQMLTSVLYYQCPYLNNNIALASMFQLSITATLTNRYYHIRLSKIPKKFPCIPQLIMKAPL